MCLLPFTNFDCNFLSCGDGHFFLICGMFSCGVQPNEMLTKTLSEVVILTKFWTVQKLEYAQAVNVKYLFNVLLVSENFCSTLSFPAIFSVFISFLLSRFSLPSITSFFFYGLFLCHIPQVQSSQLRAGSEWRGHGKV